MSLCQAVSGGGFWGSFTPCASFWRPLRNVFIPLLKCGLTPSACLPLHGSDPSCNPAGRLQSWLRCWRARAQVAARQRLQLERAELHHRWRALWRALAAWKIHHHGCARKKVRLLEGVEPSPRTQQPVLQSCKAPWDEGAPLCSLPPWKMAQKPGLQTLPWQSWRVHSSLLSGRWCPRKAGVGILGAFSSFFLVGFSPQHLQCLGAQLRAQSLSRSCFHQWRQQVGAPTLLLSCCSPASCTHTIHPVFRLSSWAYTPPPPSFPTPPISSHM